MQEIHIHVAGQIQGVGFRAIVKRHALIFQIKGYARNLPDGRVEIVAQGTADQIQHFIHAIQDKPGMGSISEITTSYRPPQLTFPTFEIR